MLPDRTPDIARDVPRRYAIHTCKSTDDRLERDYNSLESQRDVCSVYIPSHWHNGWTEWPYVFEDAAQSGGTLIRPALQRLMEAI